MPVTTASAAPLQGMPNATAAAPATLPGVTGAGGIGMGNQMAGVAPLTPAGGPGPGAYAPNAFQGGGGMSPALAQQMAQAAALRGGAGGGGYRPGAFAPGPGWTNFGGARPGMAPWMQNQAPSAGGPMPGGAPPMMPPTRPPGQ